jgi:hypothetical protein
MTCSEEDVWRAIPFQKGAQAFPGRVIIKHGLHAPARLGILGEAADETAHELLSEAETGHIGVPGTEERHAALCRR